MPPRVVLAIVLFALTSYGSQASAITLVQDNRSIDIFSTSGSSSQVPPASFANWSVARQTSAVSSTAFSGNGSGFATSDVDFFIQESVFDITFSASGPTAVTLSGQLSGEDGAFGLGEAKVRLSQLTGAGSVLFSSTGGSGQTQNFNYSDTLGAGDYRLRVYTELTPGDATGNWSFQASFVPEPATAWLLGAGILALARSGTRTTSRNHPA